MLKNYFVYHSVIASNNKLYACSDSVVFQTLCEREAQNWYVIWNASYLQLGRWGPQVVGWMQVYCKFCTTVLNKEGTHMSGYTPLMDDVSLADVHLYCAFAGNHVHLEEMRGPFFELPDEGRRACCVNKRKLVRSLTNSFRPQIEEISIAAFQFTQKFGHHVGARRLLFVHLSWTHDLYLQYGCASITYLFLQRVIFGGDIGSRIDVARSLFFRVLLLQHRIHHY